MPSKYYAEMKLGKKETIIAVSTMLAIIVILVIHFYRTR